MALTGLFAAIVGFLLLLQFFMICYFFGALMEDWDPQFKYRPVPRIPVFRNVLREKTYEQFGERQRKVLMRIYQQKKDYTALRKRLNILDVEDEEIQKLQAIKKMQELKDLKKEEEEPKA